MSERAEHAPAVPAAVLDTSALVSEQRHWLWLLARDGYYKAFWSTFIIAELVRVRVEHSIAHGTARDLYRQRINNLIHQLSDVLLLADYRSIELGAVLPDPDDEPILAAALAARAGYVVSHNVRDFPTGGQAIGVRFVTPAQFLAVLEATEPDAGLAQRAAEPGMRLP